MRNLVQGLRPFAVRLFLLAVAAACVPACGGGGGGGGVLSFHITTTSLSNGTAGTLYSQTLNAAYGTAPYAWSLTAGSLPGGLALDGGTGVISGTPAGNGVSTFTVRATDAESASSQVTFSITVSGGAPGVLVISTTTLPGASQGFGYSAGLSAGPGTPPFTWSLSGGTLPAGLTLNASTGTITGVPTAQGVSNFTVQVSDAAGTPQTDTQALSITVNAAPSITTLALPASTQDFGYNESAAGSGGVAPYLWALAGGALPAGLALDSGTGAISGTPTAAGSYAFTLRLTDQMGANVTRPLSILIHPPIVVNVLALPDSSMNHPYAGQTFSATGGTGALTWSVSLGAIPAGMTLSAGGLLDGTPTESGDFDFTVTATDTVGATGSLARTLTINPTLTITTASLPDWTQNRPYAQTPAASGGTGTLTWNFTGTLPAGLSLNTATGELSGTPTALGTSNFSLEATDAVGAVDTQAYALTVNTPPSVVTTSLTDATLNRAYTQGDLAVADGTAPFSWSVVGSLPAGINLSAGGVWSGTPTAAGTSNFTVRVTDLAGAFDEQALSITVNAAPSITTTTVPAWTVNRPYSHDINALTTGGTSPRTWGSSGTLPNGVTFSNAGLLSGTPTETGSFDFTAQVTDGQGAMDSQAYTLVINVAPAISTTTLPDWTVDRPYDQTVMVSNGTGPFTWSVAVPALPTSLGLNTSTGAITGTPSVVNTFTFTLQVSDAAGATDTQAYVVDINAAPAISTLTLPDWTLGVAYSQSLSVGDGTGPFSFAVTAGAPPTGLTLSNAGVLSGTPSSDNGGTPFGFTVEVTDAAGATDTQVYSVTINPPVAVSTTTLPDGNQGVAYNQSLAATGGTGTLSWAVTVGALPDGLSLNSGTGAITGTPTGAGTSNFTVQVTDAVGGSDSKALSITIVASVLTITTSDLPSATLNVYYHAQVAVSGGVAPFTWAVSAGSLPTGLGLDVNTGILSGTPTVQGGPVAFDIEVTDSSGTPQTDTQSYSVFVRAATPSQGTVVIATRRLPDAVVGVAYSQAVGVENGALPLTFSLDPVSSALPAGLGLNAAGTVSGTPGAADVGHFTFTVSVVDNDGFEARANIHIVVRASASAPVITTASVPDGTQDVEYGPVQLVATGGEGPYRWDLDETTETPYGMHLTRGGVLEGVPFAPGAYTLVVRVRDSSFPPREDTQTLTISIAAGAGFQFTTTTFPDATLGAAYGPVTIAHNGIDGPVVSWIADPSELEAAGLSFNPATGTVEGTPTATGLLRFIAGATNSGTPRRTAFREFTLRVQPAGAFKITTEQLPSIDQNEAYSQFLQSQNAAGTVTWTLDAAYTLPSSITLNGATGEISGTTTSYSGGDDFYIFEADDGGTTTRALVRLKVRPPDPRIGFGYALVINGEPVLDTATVGSAYSETLDLDNFDSEKVTTELRVGQALPLGLALDGARHKISGTPTVPGRYEPSFRLRLLLDDGGEAEEVSPVAEDLGLLEVLQESGFRITRRILPAGREGVSYGSISIYLEGAPDTTAYAYAVTSGALPLGLVLDPVNGTISGTPTRAGDYRFTIQVTQNGSTCSMAYQVRVNPAIPFGLATERLTNAHRGVDYSDVLSTYAAAGAVTYSDAGSPTTFASLGLSLDGSTGAVTGTPSAALADGLYQVVVSADDGVDSSTRAVQILVEGRAIQFTRIIIGFDGHAVSETVAAVGGTEPYSYAMAPGYDLPAGLSLSAGGAITGTPTMVGVLDQSVVRVTDAGGRTGYGRVTAFVLSNDLPNLGFVFGPDSGQFDGQVGTALTPADTTITAQGGDGVYSYAQAPVPPSSTSQILPGGTVALSNVAGTPNTAQFSGTPGISGRFPYVVRVTDGIGATADVAVRFRIQYDTSVGLGIASTRLPDGSASSAYPLTQVRYFTNPPVSGLSFSLGAEAPAGLSIDASTGEVSSAAPLAAGTYDFNVTLDGLDGALNPISSTGRMRLVIAP